MLKYDFIVSDKFSKLLRNLCQAYDSVNDRPISIRFHLTNCRILLFPIPWTISLIWFLNPIRNVFSLGMWKSLVIPNSKLSNQKTRFLRKLHIYKVSTLKILEVFLIICRHFDRVQFMRKKSESRFNWWQRRSLTI